MAHRSSLFDNLWAICPPLPLLGHHVTCRRAHMTPSPRASAATLATPQAEQAEQAEQPGRPAHRRARPCARATFVLGSRGGVSWLRRGLLLAGGRAAVTIVRVAIVACFASLHHAIATDRTLAHALTFRRLAAASIALLDLAARRASVACDHVSIVAALTALDDAVATLWLDDDIIELTRRGLTAAGVAVLRPRSSQSIHLRLRGSRHRSLRQLR